MYTNVSETYVWEINDYRILDYTNIYIIEDILDDSLCVELIGLMNQINMEKKMYSDQNNVECFIEMLNALCYKNFDEYYDLSTDDVKYDKLLDNIKNRKIITNDLNGIRKDKIKGLILQLNNITETIKEIFKQINPKISFNYNSGYIIRKIYGKTREHSDGLFVDKQFNIINRESEQETRESNMNNVIVRNLSAVFTLNDDYEGGLFTFPAHHIQLKLKKGSVLLFPPYWTHTHSTTELLNNTFRYTITTWYGEDISQEGVKY